MRFMLGILKMTLWTLGWLFYIPITLGVGIARLISGRWLLGDAVACPTCGGEVRLLGLWECSVCHFRFYGFYFSRCHSCSNVPGFIDCQNCGASILGPNT
jgi:hypothetical protein